MHLVSSTSIDQKERFMEQAKQRALEMKKLI